MARMARAVCAGAPHHVIQRGNRGRPAFFSDDDYRAYLGLMSEWRENPGPRPQRG